MEIEIIGEQSKRTQTSDELIVMALQFYGKFLLGRLYDKVRVTVEFEAFKRDNPDYAYCMVDDVESRRPREFIITVNRRLNRRDLLQALAHEMVHVKQYAKGDLKDLWRPARMVNWRGTRYNTETEDYWFTPWEIEAYGMEQGLYWKFIGSDEFKKYLEEAVF